MLLNKRYRILRNLARGGFGKTYLAEDTHMPSKRICVIKQLKPLVVNPEHKQSLENRFKTEAKILEKLGENNQQIPKLYAYFSGNDKFFLVQEFIEGQTLWEIASQGAVSENFVKKLLINILPVLDYLHNNGIIHRDIKPANIIIRDSDKKPVLIDFGAVKEILTSNNNYNDYHNYEKKKVSSLVIGTPGYMPSEQVSGQTVYATDLYSLGLVAIFLITDKMPEEIEKDPQTGKILWHQYAPSISPNLSKILDKAIEPHFRDRFVTAAAMLKALEPGKKQHKKIVFPLLGLMGLITTYFLFNLAFKNLPNIGNVQPINQLNSAKNCPDKPTPNRKTQANSNQIRPCFVDMSNIPQGTWFYGGSTTWNKINKIVTPRLEQVLPQFYLSHREPLNKSPGSGTGIAMLLDERLSFSQSSRPLKNSEIEQAKSKGFQLKQIPIAIDGIAVIVNHNLVIEGLTVAQIQGIYMGKITNWNQLGGPALEIKPYTPPLGSGATTFLQKQILGQEKLGKNVQQIKTPTQAIKIVGVQNDGGNGSIYLASAANLIGQCQVKPLAISRKTGEKFITPYQGKLVTPARCPQKRNVPNFEAFRNDEYPFTRRLFVIIKQDGSLEQKVGEAYTNLLLTDEGQKLIQQADFIPIRSF